MSAELHIEITSPIATVRLKGPGPERVLDTEAWRALAETFEELRERVDVACVVVCGTGSGTFANGHHVRPGAQARGAARTLALRAIQRSEHPTVAIIEGLCVGEGLQIAACCDLRVCGESSRFGAPVTSPGPKGWADPLDPLARLLGLGPVRRLLLQGELIGAERARGIGLVNHVHPDLAVAEHGYGLAARIAAGAPLVNRWHKRALHRLLDPTPVTEGERDEAYAALSSADYDYSRMTFLDPGEKRFGIN